MAANEFAHNSVGAEISQLEWESVDLHRLSNQVIGDLMASGSSNVMQRIPKGNASDFLRVIQSGVLDHIQLDGYNSNATLVNTIPLVFVNNPANGSLLLAWCQCSCYNATRTITPPAGFNEQHNMISTNVRCYLFYKIANTSESNSFTFTISDAGDVGSGGIYEIVGANTVGPFDQSNITNAATTPSLTPSVLGTLAMAFYGEDNGNTAGSNCTGVTSGFTKDMEETPTYHIIVTASRNNLTSDTVTAVNCTFTMDVTPSTPVSALALVRPSTPGGSGTKNVGYTAGSLIGIQSVTTGSSGTYSKNVYASKILVLGIGAGGGGGGARANNAAAIGAGGGSGAFFRRFITSPNSSYSYTVGTGGAGGANTGANGAAGTATLFDNLGTQNLSASGGALGSGMNMASSASIQLARPGAGGALATGNGAVAGDVFATGSAGRLGFGVPPVTPTAHGGAGGAGFGGGSGKGGDASATNSNQSGGNGTFGGGGGGGAAASNTIGSLRNANGGNGGNGVLIVWEFA